MDVQAAEALAALAAAVVVDVARRPLRQVRRALMRLAQEVNVERLPQQAQRLALPAPHQPLQAAVAAEVDAAP